MSQTKIIREEQHYQDEPSVAFRIWQGAIKFGLFIVVASLGFILGYLLF